MLISGFITESRKTAQYPGPGTIAGLGYVVFGLCGEVGECFEVAKKIVRDDGGVLTDAKKERYIKEAGDVCWYFSQLMVESAVVPTVFDADANEYQAEIKSQSPDHEGLSGVNSNLVGAHNAVNNILMDFARLTNMGDAGEDAVEDILLTMVKSGIEVLNCLCNILSCLDVTLEDVFQTNLDKLNARKEAGKIKGDGEELGDR